MKKSVNSHFINSASSKANEIRSKLLKEVDIELKKKKGESNATFKIEETVNYIQEFKVEFEEQYTWSNEKRKLNECKEKAFLRKSTDSNISSNCEYFDTRECSDTPKNSFIINQKPNSPQKTAIKVLRTICETFKLKKPMIKRKDKNSKSKFRTECLNEESVKQLKDMLNELQIRPFKKKKDSLF